MTTKWANGIDAEVAQWPGVTATTEMGGKHPRLVLRYQGRSRFVVFPASPSDYRGELNNLRDVRHACAELGAMRTQRRKAAVKRQRNKPDRIFLAHVAAAPVKANPFEALAAIQIASEPAPRKGHLRGALRLLAGSVRRMVARCRKAFAQTPSRDC